MRATRTLALAAGALAFLAGAAALGPLAGCSARKTLAPNLEPETTLFVRLDPADTTRVNHVVHLFWFGSDPDGDVVGFEFRFFDPAEPPATPWVFTTRTDSIFSVPAPTDTVRVGFEVRAVDDQGLRDSTPARETSFRLRNRAPTVAITNRFGLQDTTFASATLSWTASDPEGDAVRFRVWLDGGRDTVATAARTFTIPTALFRQDGQLRSGDRTAYVQVIDDGGFAGNVDSTRWHVRAPVTGARARLLIVDDVPDTWPGNADVDSLYRNGAARWLDPSGPGQFNVLRIWPRQPFRSAKDVEQTFALFEAVVWYRDDQPGQSALLRDHQDGIGAYLDAGGRFFLEGLNLVDGERAAGPLRQEFLRRYLGSDFLYKYFDRTQNDSSASWGSFGGSQFRSFRMFDGDSLRLGPMAGLRCFGVRDTSHVGFWAADSALSGADRRLRLPVVVSVPLPRGGRTVVVPFSLRRANRDRNAPRVLSKIYAQLLPAGSQ